MFRYTVDAVLSLNSCVTNQCTYYHRACISLSGVAKRLMRYVCKVIHTICNVVL
jgi:hypothetical protein